MGKQNLVSFVFGVIFSTAFGQEDFVVTVKGDTIHGKISFHQIGKIEQVTVKGDNRQTFSSIQVRTVKLKGKTYRPVQFSGMVQMMEILKDGYLSLLAFQPPGIMNYDGRLLMLRGAGVLEVPTLGFKKQVSNFLKDNIELADQVRDGDLDRKDLDKIIDEYNSFVEKNTKAGDQQTSINSKQISRQEVADELLKAVENSDLESKSEVLEMLTELKDKVSNNKPIPQYLSNALKEKLQLKPELVAKLETLLKEE